VTIAVITAIVSTAAATTSSGRVGDLAVTGSGAEHGPSAEPVLARSSSTLAIVKRIKGAIVDRRRATWRHEDELELPRTKSAKRENATRSPAYLGWIKRHWSELADARWRLRASLRDPRAAIRFVFGSYAEEAIAVSSCETGGTFDTKATNGQYLGLFQMGSSERATFGHGESALEQARAARAYFEASGRDWSPWSCQP
jgi:hypothetical protein